MSFWKCLLLAVHVGAILAVNETNRIPIYIGGFVEGSFGLLATETCVKHANELDGLLDRYEIFLRWTTTPRVSTME